MAPRTGLEFVEAGKTAYDEGRYEEALSYFEQAYARLRRPRTLYRIGEAADKLGLHVRAITAFQQYLEIVPTAGDRAFIESRIEANQQASAERAAERERQRDRVSEASVPAPEVEPASSAVTPARSPALAPASSLPSVAASSRAAPAAPSAAVSASTVEPTRARVSDGGHGGGAGPWWLWAGMGVVAVGGIVVAAVLLGSSAAHTPEPVHGNVGGTVQTLGAP